MPQSNYESGKVLNTSLDEIMMELAAKVPEAAQSYVLSQLKVCINEFCRSSQAWTQMLGPLTATVANNYEIDLSAEVDPTTKIQNVIWVTDERGRPYPNVGIGPRQLSITAATTGTLSYYMEPNNVAKFLPIGTEDSPDIYVTTSLRPAYVTDEVPDWMLTQFWEAFVCGTLGKLYSEPNKPYTNVGQADVNRRMFLSEVADAKASAAKNFTVSTQPSWVFPQWAG